MHWNDCKVFIVHGRSAEWKNFGHSAPKASNWGSGACAKDQLISECLFDFLNFPKNNKEFDKSQNLKGGQINKVKTLPYNAMIIWAI